MAKKGKQQEAPASEASLLKIRFDGTDYEKLEDLHDFQDGAKLMSNKELQCLQHELMTVGFISPVIVWQEKGKNYILDGHQRVEAVKDLVDKGHLLNPVPGLPVTRVHAESREEAKRMLLGLISQYGQIDGKKLKKLIKQADMSESEAQFSFSFVGVMEAANKPKDSGEEEVSFKTKLLRCPKCGYEDSKKAFKIQDQQAADTPSEETAEDLGTAE